MVFNATANRQIDDNIKTDLILKEGYDIVPKSVNTFIQPVYEVYNRSCNVSRVISAVTTGTVTLFTAIGDRDVFVTALSLSIIKDATCNIATGTIELNTTVRGVATALLAIAVISVTAQSERITISFPTPVMIDRNTAITLTGTYTLGVMARVATLEAYSNSPSQPPFLSMS